MLIKVIVVIMLFFKIFNYNAYAVQFLYRFDTRPPSELFNEGIPSLGENEDLLLHVEGQTCYGGERSTAFTSVTASEDIAYEFVRNFIGIPGRLIYIYIIRPDRHFYSVYNSLLYAYQQTGRNIFRDTASNYREDFEYVAFGGIENTNIHSVRRYRIVGYGEEPELINVAHNSNYENIDTAHNTSPYLFDHSEFSDRSSLCSNCISTNASNIFTGYKSSNDIKKCEASRIISLLLE